MDKERFEKHLYSTFILSFSAVGSPQTSSPQKRVPEGSPVHDSDTGRRDEALVSPTTTPSSARSEKE